MSGGRAGRVKNHSACRARFVLPLSDMPGKRQFIIILLICQQFSDELIFRGFLFLLRKKSRPSAPRIFRKKNKKNMFAFCFPEKLSTLSAVFLWISHPVRRLFTSFCGQTYSGCGQHILFLGSYPHLSTETFVLVDNSGGELMITMTK